MELAKLRYFVEVCRYGSMTKASEALFVSQQNISKAISSLEKEFDTSLFLRSGGSLILTPDGKYLLQKAYWILAEESVIKSHFRNKSMRGGTITIAGVRGLLARCGKAPQDLILGKNDRLNISFVQRSSEKAEEDVRAGRVRFGLVIFHPEMKTFFDVVPLKTMELSFIVSASHPLSHHETVSAYQMAQYPMAAPDIHTDGGRQINDYFLKKGLSPDIVLPSNMASEILALVRNSDTLIGSITDCDFEEERKEGLVRLPLSEPAEALRVSLISRRGEPMLRHERSFRDEMIRAFSEEAKEDSN